MKHRFTHLFSSFSKNISLGVFLAWLLLSGFAVQAHEGCLLLPLSLEQRMEAADLVVEGKVLSKTSFWDDQHENIYTSHKVEVYKVFKGVPTSMVVDIITEGGQIGMDIHTFSSTLKLQTAQQGVFFLEPSKGKSTGRYQVYGSLQGFIKYQLTDGTAKDPFTQYTSIPLQVYGSLARLAGSPLRAVQPNVELEQALKPKAPVTQNQRRLIPAITGLNPASLRAGTGDVLTITGLNFGSTRGTGYVEFKNADDGGKTYIKPLPTDYVSWTDTEIKVKVPTYGIDGGTAGTGVVRVVNSDPNTATSATELLIIYAHSNIGYEGADRGIPLQSYQPRLISKNSQGGYTFRFGTNFENNTAALYAFKRSMNIWSCSTFINWITVPNAPINRTAADNINSVRYADPGESPANVLGRCISRYKGCITGTVVNFWIDEIDLEFSPRNDWQYGPDVATPQQFDFPSVLVHELGHGHQLSHLVLPRAIMHYAVARGQNSRGLNPASDIAGGLYVMGRSVGSAVCNTKPMETKAANACAIPVESIALEGELTPNNQVLLQWTTQIEEGINEFVVERSTDGERYTPIGRVPASGNSTEPRSYQFTDPSPSPFLNYYRLRVVRSTNLLEYSEVVEVKGPNFMVQVSPNPGGQNTILFFEAQEQESLQLVIYDVSGRIFGTLEVDVAPDSRRYPIELPVTGQGLYLIRWKSKRDSGVIRYLKVL